VISSPRLAEQPAALRPVVDPGDLGLVHADRDELGQPALLTDDAQSAVAGGDQFDRHLDDLPQHAFQLKVAADGDDRFKQRVRPVPGGQNRLQPQLQFREQVIKPEAGQRAGVRALHRLYLHVAADHAMIVRDRPGRRNDRPDGWAG